MGKVIGFFTPERKELGLFLLVFAIAIASIVYKSKIRHQEELRQKKETSIIALNKEVVENEQQKKELVNTVDNLNKTLDGTQEVINAVNENVLNMMDNYETQIEDQKGKVKDFNQTISTYKKLFKERK